MTADSNRVLFGKWQFDPASGDLSDGLVDLRLEPQVAKLLAYFLDHQDTVISRAKLIEVVWENRTVSDDAINRCISILRQTLSPEETHAYIETVTRRGYVAHFPPPPELAIPEEVKTSRPFFWVALAVLIVITVLAVAYLFRDVDVRLEQSEQTEQVQTGTPVIAVLPFTTFGESEEGSLFASGIHDDLLTQLAQIQGLRVISRTSVLEYRDSIKNIRDIGLELGANAVVEGSVQRMGDQVRINAQLIKVSSDEHLWAQTYNRELTTQNLFSVQSEIARAIAKAMHTELTEQDAEQLAVLPTQNMAAYRAYHEAMNIRDTLGFTDPSYIEQLERAVSLDPSFVRAWAELAGFFSLQNFGEQDPESIARLEGMLENIRSLAPDSAEYLIAQSYYTYYVLRNYELAYELVNRAQQMRPSDVRIVELKSYIQRRLGDFDGRAESLRLAQTLDPRNPHWTRITLLSLIVAHRYTEALEEIESTDFEGYRLSVHRSVLEVRNHGNLERWLTEIKALQAEFQNPNGALDVWDAMVANREFESARTVHESMSESIARPYGPALDLITEYEFRGLLTSWFLNDEQAIGKYVVLLAEAVTQAPIGDRLGQTTERMLAEALLNAIQGNTEETEGLIRRWQRTASADIAVLTNKWHFACRLLGMAAAAQAAVECIRTGIEEPSNVMPFIEPHLPYYDPIRDEPEFIQLLAEESIRVDAS
ncbi:MAG TPA: winged helix-turn-helix domain-containing protein [Xanthomonadales bacterium]|nr:winged helix-turn-helix domain-containing protein [Xanthomonadales bacterium]